MLAAKIEICGEISLIINKRDSFNKDVLGGLKKKKILAHLSELQRKSKCYMKFTYIFSPSSSRFRARHMYTKNFIQDNW